MLRNRLITGVAVLFLAVASAGCAADLEQPPEAANTLERTVEEAIVVSEQLAEEVDVDLEQPAGETATFTIKGWVTVDAYHYDAATGTYIHFYHDESSNLLTTIGFDWIEDQLGDSPATVSAQAISLSSDSGTPAAGWTIVPGEIVDANGLIRAAGTYASTGVGVWTITNTFTASGGSYTAVRLTGLHWDAISAADNTLLAANDFTAVDLADGDSLTVTWTLTLS